MSQNQTFNGVVYPIPTKGDINWAPPLDRYLVALGTYALAPSGGLFTLTADVNFGASFGLLSAYFSGRGTVASTGLLRLSKTDVIDWRNNANSGNNSLAVDSSDNLTYNGGVIATTLATLANGKIWIGSAGNLPVAQTLTGDITVTNAGVTSIGAGVIVNSQVSNSAAIAYSKLNLTGSIINADIFSSAGIAVSKLAALTASRAVVTDGSGFLSAATTTATEIGYVNGVTSSIQSQINALSAPTNVTSINGTFIGLGRNRILNGSCIFDQLQEGSAYTATTVAHYSLDQWRIEATGTPKFTAQRSSTAPTGFTNSILFTTSVSGSPSAADGCNIEQPLEGPYVRDFNLGTANAVTFTLSFWARASITGTYSVGFVNGTTNRSYVATYVINSANTFEYKTITLTGDLSGTWTTAVNTFGLKVVWDAGSGSNFTTSSLNTWQAGGFWKATGSVSLVANAAATLYITGAQLEIGPVASAFEQAPYSYILRNLQRYLWKSIAQGSAGSTGQGTIGALMYIAAQPGLTTGGGVGTIFPTEMMVAPTVTLLNPITPNGNWYNVSRTADSGAAIITSGVSGGGATSPVGMFIQNPQIAADRGGDLLVIGAIASAQLGGA